MLLYISCLVVILVFQTFVTSMGTLLEGQCVIQENRTCGIGEEIIAVWKVHDKRNLAPIPKITNIYKKRVKHHPPFIESKRSIFVGSNLVEQPLVKVLLWTKYHKASALTAVEDWERKPLKALTHCPVRCQFTANRDLLPDAHAVVFHAQNINKKDLPMTHARNQKWVFLEDEPPQKSRWDLQEVPNVFNWTMSYRRDSDIHHPYGQVVPIPLKYRRNSFMTDKQKSFLVNKPKLVAWTVSNCITFSKREQLVVELRKFINVDVFGKCGAEQHSCINDWPDGCLSYIETKYKFYLAFENALCTQYVSEKFFNVLASNIVPVVYGLENYSSIAPPGSFIDARQFATPEQLAKYLVHLEKTPAEYLEYFRWKDSFTVVPKGVGWCRLCQKLKESIDKKNAADKLHDQWKWHPSIWTWWNYYSTDDMKSKTYQTGFYQRNGSHRQRACIIPPDFFVSPIIEE